LCRINIVPLGRKTAAKAGLRAADEGQGGRYKAGTDLKTRTTTGTTNRLLWDFYMELARISLRPTFDEHR